MSDEKPLPLKRSVSRTLGEKRCVIHFIQNKSDDILRSFSVQSFQKIRECVEIRRKQLAEHHRMQSVCNQVPVDLEVDRHFYHRWCYQKFTNLQKINKRAVASENEGGASTSKRNRRSSAAVTLFPSDSCIFCHKNRKWTSEKKFEFLTKCVTEIAGPSIIKAAEEKGDVKLLREV